jgi:hypothetical protein
MGLLELTKLSGNISNDDHRSAVIVIAAARKRLDFAPVVHSISSPVDNLEAEVVY